VATKRRDGEGGGGETYLVTVKGAIIKRLEVGESDGLTIVTGVVLQQLVDDREGATRTRSRARSRADYDRSPLAQRSPLEEWHVELTAR